MGVNASKSKEFDAEFLGSASKKDLEEYNKEEEYQVYRSATCNQVAASIIAVTALPSSLASAIAAFLGPRRVFYTVHDNSDIISFYNLELRRDDGILWAHLASVRADDLYIATIGGMDWGDRINGERDWMHAVATVGNIIYYQSGASRFSACDWRLICDTALSADVHPPFIIPSVKLTDELPYPTSGIWAMTDDSTVVGVCGAGSQSMERARLLAMSFRMDEYGDRETRAISVYDAGKRQWSDIDKIHVKDEAQSFCGGSFLGYRERYGAPPSFRVLHSGALVTKDIDWSQYSPLCCFGMSSPREGILGLENFSYRGQRFLAAFLVKKKTADLYEIRVRISHNQSYGSGYDRGVDGLTLLETIAAVVPWTPAYLLTNHYNSTFEIVDTTDCIWSCDLTRSVELALWLPGEGGETLSPPCLNLSSHDTSALSLTLRYLGRLPPEMAGLRLVECTV